MYELKNMEFVLSSKLHRRTFCVYISAAKAQLLLIPVPGIVVPRSDSANIALERLDKLGSLSDHGNNPFLSVRQCWDKIGKKWTVFGM